MCSHKILYTKLKLKNIHIVRKISKSNRIVGEIEAILIPLTRIHNCSLSWLGTDTSIKI